MYSEEDDLGDRLDADEWDEEDDVELVDCPACGESIYEEAEQCPSCGEYITHSTNLWHGRSVGWVVFGLLGMLAVLYALLFAM